MKRDPLVPENTRVVAFIRPDETNRILRIAFAAIPIVLGSVLVGYAYGRLDAADPLGLVDPVVSAQRAEAMNATASFGAMDVSMAIALFVTGFGLITLGPVLALWMLRRIWLRDEWILLRDDALVLQGPDGDTTVPWYDMEKVSLDEQGRVMCWMRDGSEFEIPARFDGGDATETAQRLETLRRKSSWGLL